jgi:hypothetical protein
MRLRAGRGQRRAKKRKSKARALSGRKAPLSGLKAHRRRVSMYSILRPRSRRRTGHGGSAAGVLRSTWRVGGREQTVRGRFNHCKQAQAALARRASARPRSHARTVTCHPSRRVSESTTAGCGLPMRRSWYALYASLVLSFTNVAASTGNSALTSNVRGMASAGTEGRAQLRRAPAAWAPPAPLMPVQRSPVSARPVACSPATSVQAWRARQRDLATTLSSLHVDTLVFPSLAAKL